MTKHFSAIFLCFFFLIVSCSKEKAATKILVFSKTAAFRHASIPDGIVALKKLGDENNFKVDATEDAAKFTEKNLKNYRAVVFLSTTGDVLDSEQQSAFEKYIRTGGGYVGVHSASDTEYDWPWYGNLVGAYFAGHPAEQKAIVNILDNTHPASQHLPAKWERFDEWYNFRSINPDIKVLLEIDEKSYQGGANGEHHPVAWFHEYDGGRSFYTALGHTSESYKEADFLKHLLGGINYALGEKSIDVSKSSPAPVSKKENTATNAEPVATNSFRPLIQEKDSVKDSKEEDWKDDRPNQIDRGRFVSSGVKGARPEIAKGLSIRLGPRHEASVAYDTLLCNVRAGWTGKFLEFNSTRYGLLYNPTIAGELAFVSSTNAAWSETPHYRGLFLNEERVVLSYDLDGASIMESPWVETINGLTIFTRTFELSKNKSARHLALLVLKKGQGATNSLEGLSIMSLERDGKCVAAAATGNAKLQIQDEQIVAEFSVGEETLTSKIFIWSGPLSELKQFAVVVKNSPPPEKLITQAGKPRWRESIETKGTRALSPSEPYVVDTITVPYQNPYNALMFLSGVDFFENGDAAVCTIHGDVWIVSGIDEKLQRLKWRRFATGLFQPLGLKIVKNQVHVLGRDQITVLHDRNGDGEADFYENFCNQIKTSIGGHDYVTSLEVDKDGNFYYIDALGLHRVSNDGATHETVATGWRNPNGMGLSPDGVITVAPQEGEWTPSSAIFEVKPGGFYGMGGPKISSERPVGYDAPLCWIPRAIDNSSGSQVWVTSDRWGPLQNQMLSLSFGRCSMMLVLREDLNGVSQGGVVPLKPKFLSGAMRGTFRPQDGQLYVVGSIGWQTTATRDGCFQRVRYTGEKVYLPVGLHIFQNGIELTFSQPLERRMAEDTGSYGIEQWNYRYTEEYGSKQYSVTSPDKVGHDAMDITSAKLSSDGLTVFLEIPGLKPVMQMQIQFNLEAKDGKPVRGSIYNSINRVGPLKNPI